MEIDRPHANSLSPGRETENLIRVALPHVPGSQEKPDGFVPKARTYQKPY